METATETTERKPVNNVINPSHNAQKVDVMALRAETVFIWFAILVTSVGFLMFGKDLALKLGMPVWLSWILGIAAGGFSGFVTDYAFRHLLEEVIFQPLAFLHPGCPKSEEPFFFTVLGAIRWILLTVVVVALFWADWYSVQAVKDPFAATAKEKETTDLNQFSTSLTASLGTSSQAIYSQIQDVKLRIKETEKDVEKANPRLTNPKENEKRWARGELTRRKAKASKSLRKDLDDITKQYNAALADNRDLITKESNRVIEENVETSRQNSNQRASLSGLYLYAGMGSKALSVILRIFLVISFLYKNKELDINGDGVVDGKDATAAAGDRPKWWAF